ncbi:MAG: FtsH protease activity modulator HflK [Planctomycetota bacterium]
MSDFLKTASGKSIPPATLVNYGLTAFAVLFVCISVISGIYTVKEYEQAVVLRFGRFNSVEGPGVHLKLPWVDRSILVDASEQSIRLPWGTGEAVTASGRRRLNAKSQDESLILTGDLYAAVVEWNVFWRISEPRDFVLSYGDIETLEQTILAVARSTMHRAVGDYSADEILTEQREAVKRLAWDEMNEQLDALNCGVTITDVQMQRVEPPNRVKPAFDAVNASIQTRDQLVNEAVRERNQLIPRAEAEKDRLIREAEGYASRRIAEADGEIAALQAKYQAYRAAPEVTRQRMYLETMEKVLSASGPKTILDSELRGTVPLLNLDGGLDDAVPATRARQR